MLKPETSNNGANERGRFHAYLTQDQQETIFSHQEFQEDRAKNFQALRLRGHTCQKMQIQITATYITDSSVFVSKTDVLGIQLSRCKLEKADDQINHVLRGGHIS